MILTNNYIIYSFCINRWNYKLIRRQVVTAHVNFHKWFLCGEPLWVRLGLEQLPTLVLHNIPEPGHWVSQWAKRWDSWVVSNVFKNIHMQIFSLSCVLKHDVSKWSNDECHGLQNAHSDPFYLSLGPVHYVPCIKWDQGHPHQRSHSGISLILISQHLVRVLEPLMQYVHRLVGVFRQAVCPHQLRRNPVCSPSWCIAECFVQIWLSVYHLLKGFRPQCYHTVLQSVTWIMRSGVVILKKGTFCKISESMRLQKLDLSTEVSAALASAARVLLQTLPERELFQSIKRACVVTSVALASVSMMRHPCCEA